MWKERGKHHKKGYFSHRINKKKSVELKVMELWLAYICENHSNGQSICGPDLFRFHYFNDKEKPTPNITAYIPAYKKYRLVSRLKFSQLDASLDGRVRINALGFSGLSLGLIHWYCVIKEGHLVRRKKIRESGRW